MSIRRLPAVLFLLLVSINNAPLPLHAQETYPSPAMIPQQAVTLPPVETYRDSAPVGPAVTNHQAATSNQMLWQQYQALQIGGNHQTTGCNTCSGNGSGRYNRCGCNTNLFPWISGPGRFDQWCVGPKWDVEAAGLFFFREDANWAAVGANLLAAEPTTTPQIVDQFEHGPGLRLFASAYNESGYGLQIGYEGINDWIASSTYAQAPAADPVPSLTRTATYETRFNSLEINFLTRNPSAWKLFSGFRYVEIDEDFSNQPQRNAALVTSAADLLIDSGSSHLLRNQLLGFQLGGRRDAWQFGNRFTVETFANAGVYCNRFRRDDLTSITTTVIVADDVATATVNEFSQTSTTTNQTGTRRRVNQIAFLGEAGVSGIWKLNPSTALRAGYQILAVDGVGQGLDAFLSPNAGLDGTTLVYHGVKFGIEYRR